MDRDLIAELICPYCGGEFAVIADCRSSDGRIEFGLLECRCFVFPIVYGVLLLSLAKGYGGPEESLQPYVPLLVAAVTYLERNDVNGLRGWIRRHLPLVAHFVETPGTPYLEFAAERERRLAVATKAYLKEVSRFEVLGHGGRRSWPARAKALIRSVARRRRPVESPPDEPLLSYYTARFFSPRVNGLAAALGSLPIQGRLLSLCCGHGVFENLVVADGRPGTVVSVDGQFLNLLVTRRYANPAGNFICHDVQLPLPFRDHSFAGVFSSTCLPEIPAQRTFALEALRVTAPTGWTSFDSIWNLDLGVTRIDPLRDYRFCQNFFKDLADYVPFFDECAGEDRVVALDVPGGPASYWSGPQWKFGADRIAELGRRRDLEASVLVMHHSEFPGFVRPERPWLTPENLSISPAFTLEKRDGQLRLIRRSTFEELPAIFAQQDFGGYPTSVDIRATDLDDPEWLATQFCGGVLVLLPPGFGASSSSLTGVARDWARS